MDCEHCLNYVFDEEMGEDVCEIDMDMDDYVRLMSSEHPVCPFFRIDNEYKIVEKQN